MFGLREPSHWLIVALIFVVLFGAKRLPDSARSVAKSLRVFKSEMKTPEKDDKGTEAEGGAEK